MKIRALICYLFSFIIIFYMAGNIDVHAEQGQVYEVGTANLNIRTAPSYDASVIGHLQKGQQVTFFKEENGWVQTYYDGETAWVALQYLIPVETVDVQETSQKSGEQVSVTASGVNIRSGPGTDYSVVGSATARDTYQLIETSSDWVKVSFAGGSGWIATHLTNLAPADSGEEVKTTAQQANGSLAGYNIVLDPGHGGKDPGSIGFNGVYEKDLINATTDVVAQHLRDAGATVTLTRSGDSYISLDERIQISNAYYTDAFVSIHYNAFPVPIVRGTSTFYYAGGEDKKLAQNIQTSLAQIPYVHDRGIRQGDFKVLRENKDLAVLIELGFITNPTELQNMQTPTFHNEAAQAITNGLINYFNK